MKQFVYIYLITFLFSQDLETFKKHVEILSSDGMNGRGNAVKEIRLAADYIKKEFQFIGLEKPASNSYFQEFYSNEVKKSLNNVIGVLKATIETEESIIFIAHYDGLGRSDKNDNEDKIFNGAMDNATGVAALIELAKKLKTVPARSVNFVFIASAGEEIASLGSKYYIKNPVYPINKIKIVLNIDGFNIFGPAEDYMLMPRLGITYYDKIKKYLETQNFQVNTPKWTDFLNDKFDSSAFLENSVPALTIWSGDRIKGMTMEESKAYKNKISKHHHTVNDEINEYWDWRGVPEHLLIYERLALFFMNTQIEMIVTKPELFYKVR